MKGWSAEEIAELRAAFSDLGMAPEAIDEHLRVLDNIAQSWVEQSYGFSSVKLTLAQRANYSFSGVAVCDSVHKIKKIKRNSRDGNSSPPSSDSKGPDAP